MFSSKVSFKPDFYSCLTCTPESISYSFNKLNGNWYDDDYISAHGTKQSKSDNDNNAAADDNNVTDDAGVDDQYYSNNDDYSQNSNVTDDASSYYNDDGNGNRMLSISASKHDLDAYQIQFWEEYDELIHHKKAEIKGGRSLYGNNEYSIGDWNMCQRLYKYGVWCDEGCRALDFFRTNNWSASDLFLLSIMCLFMTAMLLLIIAKRLKAQQKARMYGDNHPVPGLPPFAMAIIFFVIMCIILGLAKVKFINETLVFAVVTCILLFIYMLKLTLFESRRPILLAAPKHDMMYHNNFGGHLID